MPQLRYDIHCHLFNGDLLQRELVDLLILLKSVNVQQGGNARKLMVAVGRLREIIVIADRPSASEVCTYLQNQYDDPIVLTPLLMDMSYVDTDYTGKAAGGEIKRRIKLVLTLLRAALAALINRVEKLKKKGELPAGEANQLIQDMTDVRAGINDLKKRIDNSGLADNLLFSRENYLVQYNQLQTLAQNDPNVLPFYNMDPRQNMYEQNVDVQAEIKANLSGPNPLFKGLKIYCNLGYTPLDKVYMGTAQQEGIFAWCEREQIPITVHCSRAGFACLTNSVKINGKYYRDDRIQPKPADGIVKFKLDVIGLKAGEAIRERAYKLNHPNLWKEVMSKYPNLRINFAHFGGDSEIMEYVRKELPKKVTVQRFYDSLKRVPEIARDQAKKAYRKRETYMYLRPDIPDDLRTGLWDLFQNTGLIDNWTFHILEIIRNPAYPNAYTDLSAFSISEDLNGNTIWRTDADGTDYVSIKDALQQFKSDFYDRQVDYTKKKILYGSDFFLLEVWGPKTRYFSREFKEVFGAEFDQLSIAHPKSFLNLAP